ncbi:MAG: helix-turn-helix transcriptional regulator [Thermodesulfobacteriota bacterium]|nr:helix-turn-helix transcriptional regulator [Thermodesulfobacteriota bacterium]
MNRLKEIRARRRVTQFELRLKTGIHQSKISLAENGYVQLQPKEQKKIARALNVDVGEIWGQEHHAH